MLEAQPVEMEMQRVARADRRFDVVEVVGQEGDHVATLQRFLLRRRLAELHDVLLRAVVEPLIDHIALRAVDARNDGPGRMIVRRHFLPRAAGRGIEREAMVGIFAQAVDAAFGAQRELFLRKEIGAAGQRRQQAADFLEVGGGHARFLDDAGLVDQTPYGHGSLLVQVHSGPPFRTL